VVPKFLDIHLREQQQKVVHFKCPEQERKFTQFFKAKITPMTHTLTIHQANRWCLLIIYQLGRAFCPCALEKDSAARSLE
jgi:hypothetical protein